MLMLIRFFDGRAEEAILLADRGNTLRVAIRDCDDSAEFRYDHGIWLSEADDPVRIELAEDSALWPSPAAASARWVN